MLDLQFGRVAVTFGSNFNFHKLNVNSTIKRIFYHKKFDEQSPIGFDVSLVELENRVKFETKYKKDEPFINAICLPRENDQYKAGEIVKLAGWGDSEANDPNSKPNQLLQTDLVISDGQKCADTFAKTLKKVTTQYKNHKDFICAGYKGQRDACQG